MQVVDRVAIGRVNNNDVAPGAPVTLKDGDGKIPG
jgi:hypothetical protein